MTRDYRDIGSGKVLSINLSGNQFLGKITLGLWDKLGFAPKTEEDCKLVGRICRNHLKFQEYLKDYPIRTTKYFQEIYGLEILSKDDLEWLNEVVNFFENAKGIDSDY